MTNYKFRKIISEGYLNTINRKINKYPSKHTIHVLSSHTKGHKMSNTTENSLILLYNTIRLFAKTIIVLLNYLIALLIPQ